MGLLCGAGEEEENREGAGGTSNPGCYRGTQGNTGFSVPQCNCNTIRHVII